MLALVAGPMWAQAQWSTGEVDALADVFQGPGPSAVTDSDEQVLPSGVSVLAIAETTHDQRKATGFAQINADPAGAGAGVWAKALGDTAVGATAEATARASFSDGLTIDRADLTGRNGVVTVAVRYGGHATADAVGDNTAWSSAAMVARFGWDSAEASTSASVRDGVRTEKPLTDVPGATRGEFLLTTSFTWGEAIDLSFESFMSVAGYTAGQAESFASAGASGFWEGIRSVTVDDVAVRGYQLSSLSGYDYRLPFGVMPPPVPEPGMAAVMALGLVLAGLGARRRRPPAGGH
ncbi:hypothetical protein ASC87_23285 [Rhizobacter sp. Root1221]|nr:hypothetical protein ASC87_23285 [Rhizobacter sp. Root1221]